MMQRKKDMENVVGCYTPIFVDFQEKKASDTKLEA